MSGPYSLKKLSELVFWQKRVRAQKLVFFFNYVYGQRSVSFTIKDSIVLLFQKTSLILETCFFIPKLSSYVVFQTLFEDGIPVFDMIE